MGEAVGEIYCDFGNGDLDDQGYQQAEVNVFLWKCDGDDRYLVLDTLANAQTNTESKRIGEDSQQSEAWTQNKPSEFPSH